MRLRNESHKTKVFFTSSKVICNFFILFIFSNSVRKTSKMVEMCPKKVKIPIFYLYLQNMTLRNKSRIIKKSLGRMPTLAYGCRSFVYLSFLFYQPYLRLPGNLNIMFSRSPLHDPVSPVSSQTKLYHVFLYDSDLNPMKNT